MKTRILVLLLSWLLSLILLSACGKPVESTAVNPETEKPAAAEATIATEAPASGDAIMNQQCTACHGLSRITSTKASLEQWQAIVDRMILNGAKLTDAEKEILVQYLADNYK